MLSNLVYKTSKPEDDFQEGQHCFSKSSNRALEIQQKFQPVLYIPLILHICELFITQAVINTSDVLSSLVYKKIKARRLFLGRATLFQQKFQQVTRDSAKVPTWIKTCFICSIGMISSLSGIKLCFRHVAQSLMQKIRVRR